MYVPRSLQPFDESSTYTAAREAQEKGRGFLMAMRALPSNGAGGASMRSDSHDHPFTF